jgi:ABC-type multidrug transport system fused ATPase/permease subunit
LKDPPVVLLDEATSALDTVTESSIQEALWALGRNRTVLIIAHRLSTVRHADQIVVLDRGVVAEVGTHEGLLIRNGLYAKLWSMQLREDEDAAKISVVEQEYEVVEEVEASP